jgi:hypothetical protein
VGHSGVQISRALEAATNRDELLVGRSTPADRGLSFGRSAEEKVKAIAQIIGCDVDELLARAGRVASELSDIIKRHPVEVAALLRTTKGLTPEGISRLARSAQKAKNK